MSKKLFLAAFAVVLMAVSARAADVIGKLDLGSIKDADNTVVESSASIDVDALANKATDKNTDAVEVCCRSWGCYNRCCYNSCCYNYCYSPCYSYCYTPCYSYSYCYYPTYTCSYTPCYSYCSYPSYACYRPSYCCLSNWGCY